MINPVSLNSLNNSQSALQSSLQKLSSGSRINSAKDDAAGLAIAVELASQLGGDQQAARNVSDGLSLTDTASGALNQVSDSLQRMRELSVQAANGTNSPSDLQAIQTEIDQLGQGIGQIASSTDFNGQQLLNGSFSAQIQSGPNVGDTQTLSLSGVTPNDLGIAGLDVSTQANASNAINSLDSAISSVNTQQANIGAAQAGLNSTLANLSNTYENLAASKSRIADTDYAAETSNLAQLRVQQQAAIKALSVYNSVQSNVLGLIKP
jgi:flagellin